MKLKVLDKLFLKGFIGPSLLAFFIVEFVLIMQKLWAVIESILGKGYGAMDFAELFFHFSVMIIPMALPLTVLLSSVMVYGDMAEKYELSSAKSAGISFNRLLKPGLIVATSVFLFSILASNVLKPNATEAFQKKLRNMKVNNLTFAFDEQIFNREFKDFSIRIAEKMDNGRSIKDIMMYDHSDADKTVMNLIRAKTGDIYTTPDQKFLIMDLKDGYQVKEIRKNSADRKSKGFNRPAREMMRFTFSSLRKVFNLQEMMDLDVVNVSYREYEFMNSLELMEVVDSLNVAQEKVIEKNQFTYSALRAPNETDFGVLLGDMKNAGAISSSALPSSSAAAAYSNKLKKRRNKTGKGLIDENVPEVEQKPIVMIFPDRITSETKSIMDVVEFEKGDKVPELAKKNTAALKTSNNNNKNETRILERTKARYIFNLHQIYSFATVCIIFLFIGAPAGAIVRKGGFGYPLLIAIGFYITFVMSSIIGKKLVASESLTPIFGAWLPCVLLLPFALYLSWRALNDNKPILIPLLKRLRNRNFNS